MGHPLSPRTYAVQRRVRHKAHPGYDDVNNERQIGHQSFGKTLKVLRQPVLATVFHLGSDTVDGVERPSAVGDLLASGKVGEIEPFLGREMFGNT